MSTQGEKEIPHFLSECNDTLELPLSDTDSEARGDQSPSAEMKEAEQGTASFRTS